jgi:hypothetical protein
VLAILVVIFFCAFEHENDPYTLIYSTGKQTKRLQSRIKRQVRSERKKRKEKKEKNSPCCWLDVSVDLDVIRVPAHGL